MGILGGLGSKIPENEIQNAPAPTLPVNNDKKLVKKGIFESTKRTSTFSKKNNISKSIHSPVIICAGSHKTYE